MYGRSKRILVLLLSAFLSEIFAIVVIIWRAIGPTSHLVGEHFNVFFSHTINPSSSVNDEPYPGRHLCSFSGVNTNFTYLFIPVFCFEALLFVLAINISFRNLRNTKSGHGTSSFRVDSFMSILLRDSVLYFFMSATLVRSRSVANKNHLAET